MHTELEDDVIRSPQEVAYRALCLLPVIGLALGAAREDVTDWLSDHDLRRHLAPSEASFIDTPAPSRQQVLNASWLSERLVMILWALGAVDAVPPPYEECDFMALQRAMPPVVPIAVSDFVSSARLRPPSELIAMADDILSLHWEARDASLRRRLSRPRVDLEIIQERHHAINWIIGYDGVDWDEVTTDT